MSYQQNLDGVRVVLSAPQLAAVLPRQSISQTEMLSNRLWGGLQLVGSLLEMVGAGALCVLPEPTMASKAGCIVFGIHGSDSAAALRQVWTGKDTATLTQQGTTKLAEAMKASPDMAKSIGLSLDMVVPFGFAGFDQGRACGPYHNGPDQSDGARSEGWEQDWRSYIRKACGAY
jgi:hypothetical protein